MSVLCRRNGRCLLMENCCLSVNMNLLSAKIMQVTDFNILSIDQKMMIEQ